MENLITIKEALSLKRPLFIDLRSPVEYEEAHVPGAINIPLLENDERALVGTVYKNQSPDLAVDKGFEFAAPKLPEMCQKIKELGKEGEVVLYCWRGGMRSHSLSQVLSVLGTGHYRLIGGYKAFRRHVNDFFDQPIKKRIILLNGLTGVGKTEILQKLNKEGFPAIDLEGLAKNRGSVFGYIGYHKQPTQKQFEGLLFLECLRLKEHQALAVECESRRIGSLIIPASFFNAMQDGIKVLIYDSMENRIRRLTETYTESFSSDNNEQQILAALDRLRQRLGHEKINDLKELLIKGNFQEVVYQLLVNYYDPMYRYPAGPCEDYEYCLDAGNMEKTIAQLKKIIVT